jgi:hypothetical protein
MNNERAKQVLRLLQMVASDPRSPKHPYPQGSNWIAGETELE